MSSGNRCQAADFRYAGRMTETQKSPFQDIAALRTRPRQERAQQTIESILAAARHMLAVDGPAGLKMSRIAQAAGVPIGLVYRYFENNQAIEKALVDTVLAGVDRVIVEAAASIDVSGDVEGKVHQLIDAIIARFRAEAGAVDLIRNVARTDHYQDANRQSNVRLAEQLADIYAAAGVTVGRDRRVRHARVQAEIGSTMQLLIWHAEDEAEAAALIQEWKTLAAAYALSLIGSAED